MKRLALLGCIILVFAACDDNARSGNPVPYAPVQYTINITTEYPNFKKENGFAVLPAITKPRYDYEYVGYGGLLVWVGMDNEYHAADLCCPNCLKPAKPITADGIFAICPTCGEQYDISYGYNLPTKGKSQYPLKTYSVQEQTYSVDTKLRISN
jgi:nitrite reductase/ring-hydroxylating ferredoxin subunit